MYSPTVKVWPGTYLLHFQPHRLCLGPVHDHRKKCQHSPRLPALFLQCNKTLPSDSLLPSYPVSLIVALSLFLGVTIPGLQAGQLISSLGVSEQIGESSNFETVVHPASGPNNPHQAPEKSVQPAHCSIAAVSLVWKLDG